MNGIDLTAILPFIVLGGTVTIVMLAIAFCRNHRLTALLSVLGLILCLIAIVAGEPCGAAPGDAAVRDRPLCAFLHGAHLRRPASRSCCCLTVISPRAREPPEEFYLLVLVATLGAVALVASDHFASFFLGLETLSISLLGLIAYPRDHGKPVEAGVKYLILAGISSAFLLFGMALIYARLGSMEFARIAALLTAR